MSTTPDTMTRGFYHLSRAHYGASTIAAIQQRSPGFVDEVTVGHYWSGGGTTGEFIVRWEKLGGKVVPYLRAWDDAWKVLASMSDLLKALAEVDDSGIQPAEFCRLLESLGFTDLTREERS